MDSSEQLISLLKRCTVKLSIPGESGAGFFVAQDLILTCAHVVGNVESDKVPVAVQWEGNVYSARITRLIPDPYPDLALLRLENPPSSHPCVLLHQEIHIDDDLYCYGYPELYPNGDPSSFKFEGTTGAPLILIKFKSGEVRQGFSGGPLLNLRTGAVCGVMKLTRGTNSMMGGRGIPINVVFEKFPELTGLQQDYHRRDSRWYNFLTPRQRQVLGMVPPQSLASAIEIYYSFAKEDERLARELQKHLTLLKREHYIVEWYPGEVVLGQEPSELNKRHLDTARIILLLASPDFIFEKGAGSQDNYEVDLAMERSKAGAIVIPIKLRQINNWDLAPFGRLVSLPRNGKPVVEWTHIDAAFSDIAGEIRKVVDMLRNEDRLAVAEVKDKELPIIDNQKSPFEVPEASHPKEDSSELVLTEMEQQQLVDLLCTIPNIEYATVRHSFVSGLPADFQTNIDFDKSCVDYVSEIITMVMRDANFRLPKGALPIVVVIQNVMKRVTEQPLKLKLQYFLNILKGRWGVIQDETPQVETLDTFVQELHNFMLQLPAVKYDLMRIYDYFEDDISDSECEGIYMYLTEASRLIPNYFNALKKYHDPLVISYRIPLTGVLEDFDMLAKKIGYDIDRFCQNNGSDIEQNQQVEERKQIQQLLLELYRQMYEKLFEQIEVFCGELVGK